MKATTPHERTTSIMSDLRRIVAFKNLKAEALRDILNQEYLHKEDSVSIASVMTWLSGNPEKRPATISSESILAIRKFIADNQ